MNIALLIYNQQLMKVYLNSKIDINSEIEKVIWRLTLHESFHKNGNGDFMTHFNF